MATINSFEDLRVWQTARNLCREIFELTAHAPFRNDWKLKDQINASAGSVMDNIAEGFGRNGNKEFMNFLMIANGSIAEVKSQLYRASDRNYIDNETMEQQFATIIEIQKMIGALLKHLQNSAYKGQKFKRPDS